MQKEVCLGWILMNHDDSNESLTVFALTVLFIDVECVHNLCVGYLTYHFVLYSWINNQRSFFYHLSLYIIHNVWLFISDQHCIDVEWHLNTLFTFIQNDRLEIFNFYASNIAPKSPVHGIRATQSRVRAMNKGSLPGFTAARMIGRSRSARRVPQKFDPRDIATEAADAAIAARKFAMTLRARESAARYTISHVVNQLEQRTRRR